MVISKVGKNQNKVGVAKIGHGNELGWVWKSAKNTSPGRTSGWVGGCVKAVLRNANSNQKMSFTYKINEKRCLIFWGNSLG